MTNEPQLIEEFDGEHLTQRQCAEAFGVTARTLRDWETLARTLPPGLGPFPRNKDGSYHLRGMACWILLYERVKRR